MKGVLNVCEHKRLKTVGRKGVTRVFCADCGKELDIAVLEAKNGPVQPAGDTPGENPPAKKTRAKKAAKKEE